MEYQQLNYLNAIFFLPNHFQNKKQSWIKLSKNILTTISEFGNKYILVHQSQFVSTRLSKRSQISKKVIIYSCKCTPSCTNSCTCLVFDLSLTFSCIHAFWISKIEVIMFPVIPGADSLLRLILFLLDIVNHLRIGQNERLLNNLLDLPPISVLIHNLMLLYNLTKTIKGNQNKIQNKPHKLLRLLRGYRWVVFWMFLGQIFTSVKSVNHDFKHFLHKDHYKEIEICGILSKTTGKTFIGLLENCLILLIYWWPNCEDSFQEEQVIILVLICTIRFEFNIKIFKVLNKNAH